MESATIWEWVGYLASVVVAISLMMSNIKKAALVESYWRGIICRLWGGN